MSAQGNVTLNAIVYAPAGVTGGVASWMDRSSGLPNGFSLLTERFTIPSAGGPVFKTEFKLTIPVIAATDTSCVCAGDLLRSSTVIITVLEASTSTAAERLDVFNRIRDLVASVPFSDAVKNLDPARS